MTEIGSATTMLWTPVLSDEEVAQEDLPACCARVAGKVPEPFKCPSCGGMWEPTDGRDEGEDGDFGPTDWSDPDLREFALDHLEEQFAEARYLEEPPPAAAEYVRWHAAAVPELSEPEMPEDVQMELWMRLVSAAVRIAIDDKSYSHWRDLYTPEKREAARERRRVGREACGRWRDSKFSDMKAFDEMAAAIEAQNAERR